MYQVIDEQGPAKEFSSSDVHVPAANTAAVVTYAATAGRKHLIRGIMWSYAGGVPTGGNLKITDGGVTVFDWDILTQGQDEIIFPTPLYTPVANTALVITLAAGGEGVTGKVNILGHDLTL